MNRSIPIALILLTSACQVSSTVDELPSTERVTPQHEVTPVRKPVIRPQPTVIRPDVERICLDGHQCEVATDCCSGSNCLDGVCRPADWCAPIDASCASGNVACCADSFCDLDVNSYGQGHCRPLLEDGEFCLDGLQCSSGVCDDNACDACLPLDASCYGNPGGCCAGQFCELSAELYGFASCRPLLESGEACSASEHCGSGRCVEWRCD